MVGSVVSAFQDSDLPLVQLVFVFKVYSCP